MNETQQIIADKLARKIAEKQLFIDHLDPRGSDQLDFKEVGVKSLKDALMEMYEAGFEAGLAAGLKAPKPK